MNIYLNFNLIYSLYLKLKYIISNYKFMGNITCYDYYCQNISYKPEWLSEKDWNIEYMYKNINKPYNIDKGILKIKDVDEFNLLLSKKLLLNTIDNNNISIPLKFKYNINSNINIYILFTNKNIYINDILNIEDGIEYINTNFFYIKLMLCNNKINISNSVNNEELTNYINDNVHFLDIDLKYDDCNLIIIKEKLDNLLEEVKFTKNINFDIINNFYINFYINNINVISKNEYLDLWIE